MNDDGLIQETHDFLEHEMGNREFFRLQNDKSYVNRL